MARRRPPASDRGRKNSASIAEELFTPETLDRTIIALPLLDRIRADGIHVVQNVIIDVNLEYSGGRREARKVISDWIDMAH